MGAMQCPMSGTTASSEGTNGKKIWVFNVRQSIPLNWSDL